MAQFYDTLLREYIQNPGQRWLWLDALAENFFDYQMKSYKEITNNNKLSFQDVDLTEASIYSGEDVYMTNRIYQKQKSYYPNKIFEDIEMPLMQVLAQMELSWVSIDRDKLKGIGALLEKQSQETQKEIYAIAGQEFNISSPKQVGEILFEKMWIPATKKTKTWYSVSADVLEWLAKKHPIAQLIIDYRHYTKLLSTYVDGLLDMVGDDDRVHTTYNQAVTSTGRLSSTNPNLQNIPTGDGIAGEIREAFIPYVEEDFIVAFDYSQVEVRLLAIMSGDENLLQAFKDGRDIHQVTWEFIFGKKDISGTMRKFAKAVNFWVIYGISPFWLTQMIDVTQKEAKKYIDTFYESYPWVQAFFEKTIRDCEKTGYVETMFGRKRFISGINDRNAIMRKAAEREAINMPIQWTSADIIKIAMIRISDMLSQWNYTSKMIMQVHDELVFNMVPEEKDFLKDTIQDIMQTILPDAPIPLEVDIGEWKNWKQAK